MFFLYSQKNNNFLSRLKRCDYKINTIRYVRYYLRKCNAITFEKVANDTKYK